MKIEFTNEQAQAVANLLNGQIIQQKAVNETYDGALKAIVEAAKQEQNNGQKETDN